MLKTHNMYSLHARESENMKFYLLQNYCITDNCLLYISPE